MEIAMKNGPYELIVAPNDYPGKRYREKYAYEHHIVWWKHTGKVLSDKQVIHHKNGDRRDNRFTNLELMTNVAHTKMHGRKYPPIFAQLVCALCGEYFIRAMRTVKCRIKKGQYNFFCCKSHQVQLQQLERGLKNRRHSSVDEQ